MLPIQCFKRWRNLCRAVAVVCTNVPKNLGMAMEAFLVTAVRLETSLYKHQVTLDSGYQNKRFGTT